ncbi:MAG: endonuclease Q family protein [Fibrobacterota bacterium]
MSIKNSPPLLPLDSARGSREGGKGGEFLADFHIHSPYSRATSKALSFESLSAWGQLKGITLIGTGDCTHPRWLEEIKKKLTPDSSGLLMLKDAKETGGIDVPVSCVREVRFVITGEISTIFKRGGKVRKVHHVVVLPDLDAAGRFAGELGKRGNVKADGRPILGLDARDLLEILLTASRAAALIPAHLWTPWFSALGAHSGFDSVDECYADLASHIFAVETGLSSDPPMNRRVKSLDRFTLVSNSDAHSAHKIGREANHFNCALSYDGIMDALRGKDKKGFAGTLEFFPEEGKYHYDGHRDCKVRLSPKETRKNKGLCPSCGKPVTRGVCYRVEELADRPENDASAPASPFKSLLSLPELLSEIMDCGSQSKKVTAEHRRLLAALGPEIEIMLSLPLEDVARAGNARLAEGVHRIREGEVTAEPGYDGEFGKIRAF